MSYRNDQTGLIAALFDAASGQSAGWSAFLEVLVAMTQAEGAALASGPGQQAAIGRCSPFDDETVRQMRIDRVYAAENISGLVAEGWIRAVKVRVGRDGYAVLQICRAAHERDFRSAEAQHLDGLVPFLGQAVAIGRAQRSALRRTALTERVASGLGAGWILFDRTGLILDLSPVALEWGRTSDQRLQVRGRLETPDPGVAMQFRRGLAVCVEGKGPVTVSMGGHPVAEMILTPETREGERLVLGLLRAQPMTATLGAAHIARNLGVSLSEARLIMQLCDGENLRSAAVALGWTEETARSTSKQIFARLGVSGQTGLIRRVLNSALWLA